MEFNIHSYPWRFVESPSEDNFCPLCNRILNKPKLTECCGAHFCTVCLNSHTRDNKLIRCFHCQDKSVTCIQDKAKWRSVLELSVYCPYQEAGCQWTGPIKKYHTHLAVSCKFYRKEKTERHILVRNVSYDEFIAEDLLQRRSDQTMLCQNGCKKVLWRQEQSLHDKDCLEISVQCEYSYAGCEAIFKRKHAIRHLKKNFLQHSKLQSTYICGELEKSQQQREDDIKKLESFFRRYLPEEPKFDMEQTLSPACHDITRLSEMHDNLEKRLREVVARRPNMIWVINRQSLADEIKLVSVQFCEVRRAMRYEEHLVAIKQHKVGTNSVSNFLREAETLSKLQHDNILRLIGMCINEEPVLIVTEYLCHGNLLQFIKADEGKALTNTSKLRILQQVASGMAYLEGRNCVHRAVNSRSVFIGETLQCKIGSFSLARIMERQEFEYSIPDGERRPVKWSAPEVLNDSKCSTKSDVWSFGILQYEVITNEKLKMTLTKAEHFITSGKTLDSPPNCPKALTDIMMQCWRIDPYSRPSFKMVERMLNEAVWPTN